MLKDEIQEMQKDVDRIIEKTNIIWEQLEIEKKNRALGHPKIEKEEYEDLELQLKSMNEYGTILIRRIKRKKRGK